jgi:hypothetical protein
MKRIVSVRLCSLLLMATFAAALASLPVVAADDRSDRTAANNPLIPMIPQSMRPLCGTSLDGDSEPWATRYPRQYQEWADSVHGRAYLAGNRDVPGCTDCHGDPASGEIRTPAFRLDIPARCARCHTDARRMSKYDIPTDVYASYRADYHGWTIDYYRNHRPSKWRFETVCTDCHLSHAIYPPDDPRSSVAPGNLLATCQRCHAGADKNFASITTGHFRIDSKTSPLAHYIKVIYRFLIPAVIGLMGAYVGLDGLSRLVRKVAGTKR